MSSRAEKSPFGPVVHIAFVVAAAIAVFAFVSVAKEGEARRRCSATCLLHPTYAGFEKKAPSFALKDIKGNNVTLDQYRGKVVVLNFWTKTCGPCMEEMPEIADLARIEKPNDDVVVVTVSTDDSAEDAAATLKAVLKESDPPFITLIDPDAKAVNGRWGTSLYPETWIIDKNGVIRARFDGAKEWGNAAVVQYVEQIRQGGYCEVQARDGKFVSKDGAICDSINGG